VGRRLSSLAAICALAFLGVGAMGATAAGKPARSLAAADQLESGVLVELNAIRRAHGLAPVRLSRALSAAADAHSRSMGEHGYFQHESRDGSAFWKRVQRFYAPGAYNTWSVGENLLWSTVGVDADRALELWMESPAHRKNILTARWREVGLSAITVAGAPGVYGGRDVVIITTDFGVRS
jgi:uncharacterized protein YkwD